MQWTNEVEETAVGEELEEQLEERLAPDLPEWTTTLPKRFPECNL